MRTQGKERLIVTVDLAIFAVIAGDPQVLLVQRGPIPIGAPGHCPASSSGRRKTTGISRRPSNSTHPALRKTLHIC